MLLARTLRYSGLGLLLGILALGPFFQGLFFPTNLLMAIVLLALGFSLWLVGRRMCDLPAGIPGGVAGCALLALLGCYLLQFPSAVYPRGNIDWVLRVAAGWLAFVMVRAEAGPKLREWLAWTLVLSATATGFVGFLEYTGYLLKDADLAAALALVNLGDRMFTTFQYPNTAAVYFLAALFAATGLALADLKPWRCAVAGGLIAFLGLAFFFTISRGALLILPFGLLLFFAGLDRSLRWPSLVLLATAIAPVLVTVSRVGLYAADRNYPGAFAWIGLATAAGAAGGLALTYIVRLKARVQASLAAGALLVGLAVLLMMRPAGGLLPTQAARLFDMNFRTTAVILRLTYDHDAARMVADRPLGRGGWGWERSYRQYQAFGYTARETHNHYLQTAVEAGIPGSLALVAAAGALLLAAWQNRKANASGWSLASGAAIIAAHSAIDFSLSYGLLWLLFWTLLAAAAAPLPAQRRWQRPALWGTLAGTCGVGAVALMLLMGARYYDEAQRLLYLEKPAEAGAALERAVWFDPWSSGPLLLYGDRESLERASTLDPGAAGIQAELATVRAEEHDLAGALSAAKLAVAAEPFASEHYDKVASLGGTLMVGALSTGGRDEALRQANELIALHADFASRQQQTEARRKLWRLEPLKMSPSFQLRYGEALFLTGRPDEAEPYFKQAGKVAELTPEADIFLYVIYERRGGKGPPTALQLKEWIRARDQNPVYQMLESW